MTYRKIPKISPGAYIFQRPFLRGLFFEGSYLRREICVSKSIGLALQLQLFLLSFSMYLKSNSKKKPPGGLYLDGDLTEGFLRYDFVGLIFGGSYFRNFTVC